MTERWREWRRTKWNLTRVLAYNIGWIYLQVWCQELYHSELIGPTPSCLTIYVLHISRSWISNARISEISTSGPFSTNISVSSRISWDPNSRFYLIISHTNIKHQNLRLRYHLMFMNISFNKCNSFFTIWASITIHGLVHATHSGGSHPQVGHLAALVGFCTNQVC